MSTPETAATPAVQTTIAALKPGNALVAAPSSSGAVETYVGFSNLQAFELLQRVAKMFADSAIVPERFAKSIANCSIAVEMAHRLRASPLMVMQNLYVVYGNPSWSAKFLIACFNQCGRFTSIRYQFEGSPGTDSWGCRASATELSTNEKLTGPLITIKLSKDEGWYQKKGSKWPTMGEQMLRYRSAAWFINTVAPEISMGLPTSEEVGDTFDAERGASGEFAVNLESLRQPPAPASAAREPIEAQTINATSATASVAPEAVSKPAEVPAAGAGVAPTVAPEIQIEAIRQLKESGSKEDLAKAWKGVKATYKTAGAELPNEIEAAYIECLAEIERDLNR